MTMDAVRQWLANELEVKKNYDRLESHSTIRTIFMRDGLHVPTKQFKLKGRLVRIVANFEIAEGDGVAAIEPLIRAPGDIMPT